MKILYNDVHSNIFSDKGYVGQGGPSRFSSVFNNFFEKKTNVDLVPFLFGDGGADCVAKINTGKYKRFTYGEIYYDKNIILNLNKKEISRKQYIKEIQPLIDLITEFVKSQNPNLVFLNGFSVSNWILMNVAHKLSIPSIIQHAGIWKKEVFISQKHFNSSIRNIFYSFERDTIDLVSHHVFLNEFSRNVFADLHKTEKILEKITKHSSIIPLPIENVFNVENIKNLDYPVDVNNVINIGVVARWDNIKNHRAIYRLAKCKKLPKNWKINVVTKIPESTINSDFKKQYAQSVNIVAPMNQAELNNFYKKMNIVLLPSNFDVSPTVVAESFLNGVPVIISDKVGWVSEYEKCNLSNHVIKTNSSGGKIYDTILNTLQNREKNKKSYEKFVDYLQKRHNPETVFNEYFKLFKKYSSQ